MYPLIAVSSHNVCNVIFKHLVCCASALNYVNLQHLFSEMCYCYSSTKVCIFINNRMIDVRSGMRLSLGTAATSGPFVLAPGYR
jgi:hypothetical protein